MLRCQHTLSWSASEVDGGATGDVWAGHCWKEPGLSYAAAALNGGKRVDPLAQTRLLTKRCQF